MNVVVDGLMTSYSQVGDGPVLVFLHGWGDSSKTFNDLIKTLPTKYKVVALDLPGFGGTQAPDSAWGLEEYAAFVAAWLKKINVDKIEAIVAHSNGGAIAIKALSSGKLKAKKLVLVASSGVRDQHSARKKLLKVTAKSGKAATVFLPGSAKDKLKERFYKSIGSEATMLPQLEETFRKIVDEDIQDQAAKLKLPTLLIYGDLDKATPLAYGELLAAQIKGSQLTPIKGGGHFIHQQQAHHVAELISDFLAEA